MNTETPKGGTGEGCGALIMLIAGIALIIYVLTILVKV